MQAIRVEQFGEPGVMRVADVPPPIPGPGQVLVRVHAAGVNPVDTYIRAGTHARKPPLPFTPGLDAAGVVIALGAGVTQPALGSRVYLAGSLSGTYAEEVVATATQVHPLPEHVSFAAGAALGIPYTTAWRALFQRGGARAGECVLVHGASGGVGLAALQLARAANLRVLGTAGSARGSELVREQGAHDVFDHHAPDYRDRLLAATGGRGVDLILEMLANVNLGHDLALLAPRGRVVVIGSRGPIEINPRDAMAREADVRGMLIFNATPAELAEVHAGIGNGLRDGTLRPVIAREFPLGEAPAAHHAVMAPGAQGKIVLRT